MDVLDLVIQIQSFIPIFQRKKCQLISKVWYDAYFIALKNDNSQFVNAYRWWKNKKIDGYGSWFNPNDKNIIPLAYSDKIFGELCYHKEECYLFLVSRIFKLAKILMRWEIFPNKRLEYFFVEKDYQLNIYAGQTIEFVDTWWTDAILINLETTKVEKFASSHIARPIVSSKCFFTPIVEESHLDQKYSFVNNGSYEHFLMNISSEILKMEFCLHLTDHEENENGILIALWPKKQKILIPSDFKLKNVHYVHFYYDFLSILLLQKDDVFFSILVNEKCVGFYKSAIFFDPSQKDAIDCHGQTIETIELIDHTNSKQSTTFLDSQYIQKLLNS